MNSFFIENNNRDDNLGDQIISRNLSRLLSHFGTVRILGTPKPYHEFPECGFNISSSRYRRLFAAMSGHSYYRVFPAGGWGRLKDVQNHTTNSPMSEHQSKSGTAFSSYLKGKIAIRDIVMGISVEIAPDNPSLDSFHWVGARDQHSMDSLKKRPRVNVSYFPDLCFYETETSSGKPKTNDWAISFREQAPGVDGDLGANVACKAIQEIVDEQTVDSSIVYYYQVDEDREHNRELAEHNHPSSFHGEKLTLQNYHNFYSRPRYVAGNRLHCLLLGALNGALPVAFVRNSHTKIVEFFHTVGWGDLLVPIENVAMASVVIKRIVTNHKTLAATVAATCNSQRQLGIERLTEMFGSARSPLKFYAQ